jgi:hypothetical protein
MTSNDAQIDVLLRRYTGQSPGNPATEHLDADELNAFAEGSLPAAARTRYVSHLLECDNCRQIVSQLAISSGAVVAAEAFPATDAPGYSWWKRLSGFLSPMTLRYAAFAMVLITVAGVVFLVTQRPREFNELAQSEQTKQAPETAVKPPDTAAPQTGNSTQSGGNDNKQGLAASPTSSSQASPTSDGVAKLDQPKVGDNPALPAAPAKAAKEAEPTGNPALAANKKPESAINGTAPAYSPPPPIERQRAETESRELPNVGGVATASGPRKSEQPIDKFKAADRGRGGEAGKDSRVDDANTRLAVNQAPASKRVSDEKVKGPRRDADNSAAMSRSSNVVNEEAIKNQGVLAAKPAAAEEKTPDTRSAGGRKFKRQGSAWVDTKFKSSMTLKSISRRSSEFDALDSGIRSIAQQLGGEVIIVWKGRAYVIK